MAKFIPVEPFDIVIFGGTGDLSKRKLIPALFHRFLDGQIHATCRIVGVARSKLSRKEFIDLAKKACENSTNEWSAKNWTAFSKLLEYVAMDITSSGPNWKKLKDFLTQDGRPHIFYLATTPLIYVDVCRMLGEEGLNTPSARLVLEKPIGTDLASAQAINKGVGAVFEERAIYRIDHYLGKETVQNLIVLRFANALFEPVWSRNAIDHVQITVSEDIGLEGRADYYDRSGAVRDMMQNHLLQLLCLTTMEPPNSLEADDVRTEKIKVLKALKPYTDATILQNSVRAQYDAGLVKGEKVDSYQDTLSGNKKSKTETFAALKVEIENGRWAGVPFYLRTGKRMEARRSSIMIQFKPTPHPLFSTADRVPNRLVMRLQPDEGMKLFLQIKEPGPGGMRLKYLPLDLSYAENFAVRYPDAYERLLMDVVRGNLSWVDQLLAKWEETSQPLETYPAGTQGPMQSAILMDRDGRQWWDQ